MANSSDEDEYTRHAPWTNQLRYNINMKDNDYRLFQVLSLGNQLRPATWGITIVRIDYKAPRQQLLNALACINDAVQADLGAKQPYAYRRDYVRLDDLAPTKMWPSLRKTRRTVQPGDELFARYSMEVLSTYDGLNEASVDTMRSRFQSWIMQMQGNPHGGDMRYVFCLILDADTIQTLDDIWCRRSRVRRAAAQLQTQVRVLDAMPGGACGGAYKVYLRGAHGLVNFWFARNLRRQPLEVMLTRPRSGDDDAMWYFGPEPQPVEDGANSLVKTTMELAEDV
ncbi:hypothetical protein CCM_03501 [Cordyceps militaris CM01]|uniref:Uncharacterized protein n=1 Tax=Cordyceps militaris (strain CM01) TaxID=983644 RepID=G3JB17_CORMM|nr:uncharacterized protein CCM_03501 [Cordyceps militaris CM01]EGX95229.1 hypothetical protein CCM_03501 [Cordyceps militaris CM01]